MGKPISIRHKAVGRTGASVEQRYAFVCAAGISTASAALRPAAAVVRFFAPVAASCASGVVLYALAEGWD